MTPRSIVFVHGMWCRSSVWQPWRVRFERAGYTCDEVTLPGHEPGATDGDVAGQGLAEYTDAVVAALARIERPILLGHSLGGLIAQQVATRVALSALVLVSSAAPAPIFPLRFAILPPLFHHFARWGLWRSSFRLSRREARYLLFNRVACDRQAALYEGLIAESGRVAYQLAFGKLNRAGTNRVDVDRVRCPILSLAGVHDRIVPVAVSRKLAALYGARLEHVEFPAHAHWMFDEPDGDRCADDVIAWLSRATA